jgi:hypothetical protein
MTSCPVAEAPGASQRLVLPPPSVRTCQADTLGSRSAIIDVHSPTSSVVEVQTAESPENPGRFTDFR